MQVELSFLTLPGLYVATVPDCVGGDREAASTLVLNGCPRAIHFGPPDPALRGHAFRKEVEGPGSLKVALYDQVGTGDVDPLSAPLPEDAPELDSGLAFDEDEHGATFIYWPLTTGSLSTFVYPEDGSEGIRTLLNEMVVTEKRLSCPSVELSPTLGGGDIRDAAERDTVILHAREPGDIPDAVTFTYAGAFATDGEVEEGGVVSVSRATALGVILSCDGPAEHAAALRAHADNVAASLRLMPG